MKRTTYKTNQSDPQVQEYKQAVERGSQSHHVIPRENSWIIVQPGEDGVIDTFGTQQEAIAKAKSIAQNQGTSVYIHGVNGKIREIESYGNDPFPPQDTTH